MMTAFYHHRVELWGLACLCFLLLSCNREREAIVQAQVAERVTAFKAKKSAECRERLLQRAEQIVDSLLLTEAQIALNDSLARLRPGRPFQPAAIPPLDSFSVLPIFGKTSPASETGNW